MDLVRDRYYIRRIAGVLLPGRFVGRVDEPGSSGSRSEKTKEYAINLGIALQLTNILRDVSIDAKYGRVYLPQEDLRRFGFSEADLFAHRYTPAFRSLIDLKPGALKNTSGGTSIPFPPKITSDVCSKDHGTNLFSHAPRIKKAGYNVLTGRSNSRDICSS